MSLLPTCVVCDALLRQSGTAVCDRCKEPCQVCGGNVAKCQHPLRPVAGTLGLTETRPDPLKDAA